MPSVYGSGEGVKKALVIGGSNKEFSGVCERRDLRGRFWIGDNEYGILKYCLENGLVTFTLKEVAEYLEVDVRRAYDAVQRLVRRGWVEKPVVKVKVVEGGKVRWVEKPARGLYRLKVDPADILSKYRVHRRSESMTGKVKHYLRNLKNRITNYLRRKKGKGSYSQGNGEGSRVPVFGVGGALGRVCGGGVCGGGGVVGVVEGPLFDNVRGYGLGGGYVGGDRGRVLSSRDLVFFSSVSYAEVLWRVRGFAIPGQLVVYTNGSQDGYAVRIEYRPVKDYVKKNGLASLVRIYWEIVLTVWKALTTLIQREAPLDVIISILRFLKNNGIGRILCSIK